MAVRRLTNAVLIAIASASAVVVAWCVLHVPDVPVPDVFLGACALAPLIAGALLSLKRPDNVVGTLLLAFGAVVGTLNALGALLTLSESDPSFGPVATGWLVCLTEALWPALFVPPALIALVFPDGRLPGWAPRRAFAWVVLPFLILLVAALFDPDAEYPAGARPPLPVLPDWAAIVFPLTLLGAAAALVMMVRVVRRRSREAAGVERLQIRWFAWAAGTAPLTLVVCIAASAVGAPDWIYGIPFAAMLVAIPVAIAFAITRHRLYDIDRLVNRTIVYGVLTAVLALAWGAIVIAAGMVIGGGSPLVTAGATLAVGLAARPLRDRVQRGVDLRFDRDRVDAFARLDAFLDAVRAGEARPEQVAEVLAQVLDDPALEVRFVLPESELVTDAAGRPALPPEVGDGRLVTEVRHGQSTIGFIAHSERLVERPMLLDGLIKRAGLAIEIARLQAEVARQLAEVQDSRRRIVEAQDEERRRMERDLHDGAQQRLVSLGMTLRHVQHVLPDEQAELQEMLDAAVDEVASAVKDLRELARGVRPAPLDDGLLVALRDLARRAPADVSVRVDAGPERYAEPIEAAAWFTAAEALTNAVKHAAATRVDIAVERTGETMSLTVRDDGRGGAEIVRGGGLAGLSDRIAALGGRLRVRSDGAGTSLRAEFPCAS